MANEQNLKRPTASEARERGSKGGKASGKARREKADLRKMAQQVLDGTYKDKDGNDVTGAQLVIRGLIANLNSPKGTNWGKTIDVLVKLLGADKSAEETAQIKAQTALLQAKVDALSGTDDETLKKLDDVLGRIGE